MSVLPVPLIQQSQNDAATAMCKQLGQVLMCCYYLQKLVGQCIDHSVFQVACALTGEEIDTSFENLSEETKIRLYRAIIEGQGELNNNPHNIFLKFLETGEGESDVMQQLSYYIESEQMASIVSCRGKVLWVGADRWDAQLRAMHALASGMKDIWCLRNPRSPWGSLTFTELDSAIQGTIDREHVANAIQDGLLAHNHVQVLKNWILSEATIDQVKAFLRCVVGAGGLGLHEKIYIKFSRYLSSNAEFGVHACSREIDVNSQVTPETFLDALISEINNSKFTMA